MLYDKMGLWQYDKMTKWQNDFIIENYGRDGGLQERAGDGELAAAPRRLYSNSIWNCMEFHMEGFLNFRMEEFQKNLRMEYGIWKFHTHHQYGKYGIYSIFQFDTRSNNSNLITDLSYVYPYCILLYSAITTLIVTY